MVSRQVAHQSCFSLSSGKQLICSFQSLRFPLRPEHLTGLSPLSPATPRQTYRWVIFTLLPISLSSICGACALPVALVPCEPEDLLALGGERCFLSHRTMPRVAQGAPWSSRSVEEASHVPVERTNRWPVLPVIAMPLSVLGGTFPPLPARSFARNRNLLTPEFPAKTAALGLPCSAGLAGEDRKKGQENFVSCHQDRSFVQGACSAQSIPFCSVALQQGSRG